MNCENSSETRNSTQIFPQIALIILLVMSAVVYYVRRHGKPSTWLPRRKLAEEQRARNFKELYRGSNNMKFKNENKIIPAKHPDSEIIETFVVDQLLIVNGNLNGKQDGNPEWEPGWEPEWEPGWEPEW